MSLTVVSTPIGNIDDITLRALKSLAEAQAIICEETKPIKILLKRHKIPEPPLYQLNEHTRQASLPELVSICRTQKICLVTDCGTPGFCDPGALLVDACLKEMIPVDVNPGASSLMTLMAISGVDLKQFYFVGFLPAEKMERSRKIDELRNLKVPFFVMDTPYRLNATLQDLAKDWGGKAAVLGVDLTGENQSLKRNTLSKLAQITWPKAPFVLLVIP